jgi:hypothetical protein
MRTMLKATMPVEKGNQAIMDGSLPRVIQQATEALRPEASYFYTEGGKRTALMVFDLKDAADIPSIAEPLFNALNCEVTLAPVMNAQDLQTGLGKLPKK